MIQVKRALSESTLRKIDRGEIPPSKVDAYHRLVDRIEHEILTHEVIVDNRFTRWFAEGRFDRRTLRHFLVQFSVFSNSFIVAQLLKTINAPTLEAMRASKQILMNELGVVFRNPAGIRAAVGDDVDPELVGTEGTVEGGTFRFAAAHFEWLLRVIPYAGLAFADVGKRRHGTANTLFFCDELARLYASSDPHVALGASFAVENWAAAGFWRELIQGLEIYREREALRMPLAFFTWHDHLEEQHATHTWDELEEEVFGMELDEEKFFRGAREMLDGVLIFWSGLDADRRRAEEGEA